MINILFFIEQLSNNGIIGGAEKVLFNLVNHMDPSKYSIVVQTVFPDPLASKLSKKVKYEYCYDHNNRWTQLQYRFELQSGSLYKKRIQGNYDIEVAYLEFGSTKAIAASTNKTAKKVAWVHCDFNIAVKDKEAFVKKTAKIYSRFDRIVCVSEQCKNSFIDILGLGNKISVLRNVVDDKEIIEKAGMPIPDPAPSNGPIICSVGRFSPPKNHVRLLKAAKKLWDEGFKFQIWLVGDGALRSIVEDYIRDNKMEEYVSLLGFQSNPYPYMKKADLLVCHSDYEGYSTMATEAVILNKPILTTECSGMHEILDEYEDGRIVPNNDDAFFDGLKAWLVDNSAKNERKKDCPEKTRITAREIAVQNENFFEALLE